MSVPLGDSDAIAVISYFDKFREEFQAHIDDGCCPFDGSSSLDRLLAPVAMHIHEAAAVQTKGDGKGDGEGETGLAPTGVGA